MNKNLLIDITFAIAILLCLFLISAPFLKIPAATIVVLLFGFLKKKNFLIIGLHCPKNFILQIFIAFGFSIVLVLLNYWIFTPMVSSLTGQSLDLSAYKSLVGNGEAFLNMLLIGWIIGGVGEELVFRGFLLNKLIEHLPIKWVSFIALMLTSILFGFLHGYQGITGQYLTGIMGFMLGLLALLNQRSIWLSVWTHGFYNTISILMIYKGWFEI